MIRTRLFLVGSTVAVILSARSVAHAADVYFDTVGGDDTKDGTTEATAKKTIKITSGNSVHIKRGSSYSGNLNLNNATVGTYGCGPRVIINGSVTLTNSTIEGLRALPTKGNAFTVQSGNTMNDCEADGSASTTSTMCMGVMGENNKIFGTYCHDFNVSESGSTVNNSGGAEGIFVMASNNEIAYNSVVNCQSVNTTLGGYEGGCFELLNTKAGATIHDVSFHHNYCEHSVGLFESETGDYSATAGGAIQNHGINENVTVAYNVSVDSCWLFLLQVVNTDFKNYVFANNLIIHTPKSAEYWDSGGGHFSMALAYDSDTSTGTTIKADNQYYSQASGFAAGTIALRNNIFVDTISSSHNVMFMNNIADHSNNLFVPANASVSFAMGGSSTSAFSLNSTESKVDLAALALTADYQLTAASTPAIDKGTTVSMTMSTLAASPLNAALFANAFNQDVAGQPVPCGLAPDIGPSEYCNGTATLVWPGPSDSNSCAGTGGTPSTGGASGAGGSTSVASGTGGSPNTGGRIGAGGAGAVGSGGSGQTASGGGGMAGSTTNTTSSQGGTAGQVSGAGGAAGQAGTAGASNGGNTTSGGGSANTGGDTTGNGTGGAGAGGDSAGRPASAKSGCSCRVAGSSRQDLGVLALGALGLVALARARRRHGPSRP